MLYRYETLYCLVCGICLGSQKRTDIIILTCPTEDCNIKWCWKPKDKKPIALDYPGKPKSKTCACEACKARDKV